MVEILNDCGLEPPMYHHLEFMTKENKHPLGLIEISGLPVIEARVT